MLRNKSVFAVFIKENYSHCFEEIPNIFHVFSVDAPDVDLLQQNLINVNETKIQIQPIDRENLVIEASLNAVENTGNLTTESGITFMY